MNNTQKFEGEGLQQHKVTKGSSVVSQDQKSVGVNGFRQVQGQNLALAA